MSLIWAVTLDCFDFQERTSTLSVYCFVLLFLEGKEAKGKEKARK